MGAYGAVPEDPEDFAANTVANQQRLLKNNYVPLTKKRLRRFIKIVCKKMQFQQFVLKQEQGALPGSRFFIQPDFY